MKIKHKKKSLPRFFDKLPGADRAILIGEVKVTKEARTRVKILVFKNTTDLRYFWKNGLKLGDLGRYCRGAVTALTTENIIFYKKGGQSKPFLEVDQRYFAVMGLVKTHLSMEIICHESVHAGIYYERRQNRKMWPNQKLLDEEGLCYPVGRIASGVNKLLHDNDLYGKSTPSRA